MTIKRNLSAKVQGSRMVLDSPIYFYQGDRDICLVITITGNKYIYDKDTKLSFVIVKPNGEVVENAMSALINGKYNVLLTRELFDGVDEVGQFLCQLRQHNGSAIVSLPPFAIHVLKGYSISLDDTTDGLLTEQEFMLLTENNKSLSVGGLIKISDLPTTTKVEGYTPVTQGNTTYKLDMSNVASKTYVATEIAKAQLSGEEIDLSSYATKEDLTNELTNKANKEHTHTISDVDGLQAELDGKAIINHTHSYNQLTDTPTIPSLDGYATETFVTEKIAEASLGGEVDLSAYATKDELATKADKTAIPTKTSQLTNDKGYLTSVPSEYVTDEELNAKGYLTEHQDLSDYALKTDIPTVPTKTSELTNDTGFIITIPTEYITESELNTQLSTKANISDIPSLDGYATETFVTNKIAEASLSGGGGDVDLSGYATKDDLNSSLATKSDVGHTHEQYLTEHQDISMKADKTELHSHDNKTVLDGITSTKVTEWNNKSNFDGNYNSLTNKPTIPTIDVNKNYVDTQLATKANVSDIPNLDGYALKTDIPTVPTKVSELANDSGFITSVPSEYITETELDAKSYATETYVQNKIAEASLSGGEVDLSGLATKEELATKADISSIPTKTSQLTNDSGFINSIPSEYVTETELNAKGYLTEHQDISGKANISDLSTVATSGNYNDLINTPTIPNEYVLPIASTTTLGGIKVGSGLSIDSNGILSATSSGSGSSTGNGIIFNDTYVENCNTWLSNGYIKTSNETTNLPSLCTGADRWGILFFIAENATNGTGTQMYFPIDGVYKGRVFTRSLVSMSQKQVSEWVLLAIQSDIPSIDGLATETYVNDKMTPNLVENTVANKTLTLTVDKYQYAVLSNGDSVVLPSVSSFTEIHLFFKASTDLTLTFPSVRWQSIPSITSGHTYEIIFTYVVDEWLVGIICYE